MPRNYTISPEERRRRADILRATKAAMSDDERRNAHRRSTETRVRKYNEMKLQALRTELRASGGDAAS